MTTARLLWRHRSLCPGANWPLPSRGVPPLRLSRICWHRRCPWRGITRTSGCAIFGCLCRLTTVPVDDFTCGRLWWAHYPERILDMSNRCRPRARWGWLDSLLYISLSSLHRLPNVGQRYISQNLRTVLASFGHYGDGNSLSVREIVVGDHCNMIK